ncbi:MAG: peptidylprolyl isomerase [Acidobacteriota bacterium]
MRARGPLLLAVMVAASVPARAAGDTAKILQHEDRRDARDGYLAGLLKSPSSALRSRAALALGRIGDPGSIDALAALLADPDASVRGSAVFALGEIGDPAIVPKVAELALDPDPAVRVYVAEALSKAPTADGLGAAMRVIGSDPKDAIAPAAYYLFRFKDPAIFSNYLNMAERNLGAKRGSELQRACLYTFARFDWKAASAAWRPEERRDHLDQLLRAAEGLDDDFAKSLLARSLGRFPEVAHQRREDMLHKLLASPGAGTRIEALRAVGELGRANGGIAGAWPEVVTALSDANPNVAVTAIETLGAVGGPGAIKILQDTLARGTPRRRALALQGLLAMGAATEEKLMALADDPELQVRMMLATSLGSDGVSAGGDVLRKLAACNDARVAAAALSSIATRGLPGAAELLASGLAAEDFVVRGTAADEIGKRDDAKSFAEKLRACWKTSVADVPNDARLSLLDAFAKAEMKPELESALADKDWLVRTKAAMLCEKADGKKRGVKPLEVMPGGKGAALKLYQDALDPKNPKSVTVRTDRGEVEIELFWDDAPLTCWNFLTLARKGFYDGIAYHRVVPDFVVQGGCPRGDGNGGPGWQIRCEINRRRYDKGMVGMALSGKDTGGSQYFFTLTRTPHLDGGYTIFGRVTRGMDVVERIEQGDKCQKMTAP